MNYSKDNSKYKILYFGDSITYGSPYKSNSNKHIFSIPYRVKELLGCVYYNPSIPGSTYHDLGQKMEKILKIQNIIDIVFVERLLTQYLLANFLEIGETLIIQKIVKV